MAMAELEEGPWFLGNLEGVDADRASQELIGKKVKVGHKVVPPMRYSAGEGVAVTFFLAV
ncbi:MAG: hypothetical protein ACPLRH_04680 [Desulfotomaculales bacterium]